MTVDASFQPARQVIAAMLFFCVAGLSTLASSPAAAFVDPMLDVSVQRAIDDGRTNEAVRLLEEALAAVSEDDLRARLDLLERIAAVQEQAKRHNDAAGTWVRLAETVIDDLGEAAPEQVPYWDGAAAAFERDGDLESAAIALENILGVLTDTGQADNAKPFVDRLQALAEVGNEDVAEQIAGIIAAFRDDAEQSRAAPTGGEEKFTSLRIFYATDRARSGSDYPSKFYGGERGELEMGSAIVSIPHSHKPGQLEKPSIWSFDVRLNPDKHIVLKEVHPKPADEVFSDMRKQVETSGNAEAFVFVHGFNVTFNDAARRTAQMAYDMNFDGLPVLYSWPSRGSVLSYIADTAVVNLSGRRLSLFLEELVQKSGATRIHLIAHSMGNRAMTDALELFALRNAGKPAAFDQVLFTAPDLDAGLFAEMARTIKPVAKRMTLYASNKDWALAVSRRLHGDAARAGQGGDGILLAPAFDTVDMTMIGEDILAHSYFANNASALTDIFSLFWRDAPPDKRCGMIPKEGPNGASYWHYAPEQCDGPALLSTLSILKRGSVVSVAEARAFFNRYIGSTTIDPKERSRLLTALGNLFGS